ncbi:MAG: hypothetical protein GY757_54670, partial [bacterium]|nr:hypothetical protein [bacterium]
VLEELEDEFAKLNKCKYALAMSSGTITLLSAFKACRLEPGDEVIAVSYSYHATVTPLLHLGVKILFCDVEPDTGNISVEALRNTITEKTKAIVTNHTWGHPVDADGVREVLEAMPQKVYWIEDCSHAHFATYNGKMVGSFGDVACFSLQGHKIIPAGEGGLLITNDEEIHDIASLYSYSLDRTENFLKLDKYRTLGRTGLGLKHRIHPLGALVALHNLKHNVPKWISDRNEVVGELTAGLKELPGINPPVDRPYVTSRGAFYGYKALFDPAPFHGKVQRKELILALREEGLYVKLPGSPPIYRLPLFTNPVLPLPSTVVKVPEEGLPGAEHYFNTIITFPIFTFPEERQVIQAYLDVIKETTARFI